MKTSEMLVVVKLKWDNYGINSGKNNAKIGF